MNNLGHYIDHSPLNSDVTHENVIRFCNEAKTYGFCSVLVHPCFIPLAARELNGSGINLVSLVGFPFGNISTEYKVEETYRCIRSGANEIDMVMNIGAFKEKNERFVIQDIRNVVQATCGKARVKVIIETGLLEREEMVLACNLIAQAGAHFVKTSTGYLRFSKPATVEDVQLMYETVKDFGLEVKASGGIRNTDIALAMVQAGATRLGTTSGIDIVTSNFPLLEQVVY